MLTFLQELLDKGRTPSTLKVYVAAIAANHSLEALSEVSTIGRNDLVVKFLRGTRRLNPPRPKTMPTWDLSIVLGALKGAPFELLQTAGLRVMTLKTALLLVLASVKRVGDLQALSVCASCLELGPNDCKVILQPRSSYVPKVLSIPFRAQVISLLALPVADGEQGPNLLCPVRALRVYFELSKSFRQTEQLFVCFGGRSKGLPVTKQRLSHWIVDAIALAYASAGVQCPIGVRAHSAWSSGISIGEICTAAGWSSQSTFIRLYSLDVPALLVRVLSA